MLTTRHEQAPTDGLDLINISSNATIAVRDTKTQYEFTSVIYAGLRSHSRSLTLLKELRHSDEEAKHLFLFGNSSSEDSRSRGFLSWDELRSPTRKVKVPTLKMFQDLQENFGGVGLTRAAHGGGEWCRWPTRNLPSWKYDHAQESFSAARNPINSMVVGFPLGTSDTIFSTIERAEERRWPLIGQREPSSTGGTSSQIHNPVRLFKWLIA